MTRTEKIKKLSNAVKSYRGICTPIVSSNDGFTTIEQFNAWIKTL